MELAPIRSTPGISGSSRSDNRNVGDELLDRQRDGADLMELPGPGGWLRPRLLLLQVALVVGVFRVGVAAGTGYPGFVNADWRMHDAVPHDLTVGAWPVGAALALLGGVVPPCHGIARSLALPAWPRNHEATLTGTSCDAYPPHYADYVAHLRDVPLRRMLRPVPVLDVVPIGSEQCLNPAMLLTQRGVVL